ncbi:MAG: HNH endonuclease family protein [Hyphomicrobium sp.]|uniref:HNH endonuclease family protein n=1 Tax=Hyphomicrobium sp. TaxID=82 RepID=UPI003D11B824
MATSKNQVNLDALIPRADLFEVTQTAHADSRAIRITDLKPGLIYQLLRKPDFQRETVNWTPLQVVTLIKTFVNSDIIPAIILWQSGGQIFVVDGAHRLSALVGWVRNDYGAGEVSQTFFQGKIPDQQRALHEQTAEMVESAVGPWAKHENDVSVLGLKEIQVQWITSKSPREAAQSFIRINQGGTVIDNLEVRILKASRSALAVASRLIARGGTGYEYWRHFSDEEAKKRAPKLASDIHRLLFHPALETPVKTLDVPLAGVGYGSDLLRLSFDLVALTNSLPVPDSTRKGARDEPELPDDNTGRDTVKYLMKVRRTLQLILSSQPPSLGLHPALYFYTAAGAFQQAALLNAIAWFLDLEKRGKLIQFLRVRGAFETLILDHPVLVKPAAHTLGSGARTRGTMITLFERTLEILTEKPDADKAWKSLTREFSHLADDDRDDKAKAKKGAPGKKLSRGAKSAAFLSNLAAAPRCELCGGLMHRNGMSGDHKVERSKRGSSASENARMTHPICNSDREKMNAENSIRGGRAVQSRRSGEEA